MKKKDALYVLGFYIFLYIIQYLIIPKINDNVYDYNSEATTVLLAVSAVAFLLGVFLRSVPYRYWLLGYIFFVVLQIIYTPPGAYGVGTVGFSLDDMSTYYDKDFAFFMMTINGVAVFVVFNLALLFKKIMGKIKIFLRKNKWVFGME